MHLHEMVALGARPTQLFRVNDFPFSSVQIVIEKCLVAWAKLLVLKE